MRIFKDMGDYPQESYEIKNTPWGKDYLIRVLPAELVPDYTPFTAYEMVAMVSEGIDGEGNPAGIKTKRIVLSKKESEVDYADDESGIEMKFEQLIPRDSDI